MKAAIAIVFALLAGCVDDAAPMPDDNAPAATYCSAHLDSVVPAGGFSGVGCAVTVTVEMFCTAYDADHQTYDDMLVQWLTQRPTIGDGEVAFQYRCNDVQTVTLYNAPCSGAPYTVAAGFRHPVTGEGGTDNGTFVCADARVIP